MKEKEILALIYGLCIAANTVNNSDQESSSLDYEEIAKMSLDQAVIAMRFFNKFHEILQQISGDL